MPLKVIVIGAGLGGLAAAIALTRAGHDVEVFESSAFSNEVGAAIHIAPNASRILRSWDMSLDKLAPVICRHLSVWNADGTFIATPAVTEKLQQELGIDDDWLLVHRVDLHHGLRELAEQGFAGKTPQIRLSSRVDRVDSETGEVHLVNGTVAKADLIIGADGVHSRTVQSATGRVQKKISTGQSCFRFLVPVAKANENPLTKQLVDRIGLESLHAFCASDRRIIIYPCRTGTILNVVAFHPSGDDESVGESSWLNTGSLDDLVAVYSDFSPEIRALCSLAEDLKLWSLASRDPPHTFVGGKVALIGDAAHPMLPHQGQGAAQAFEDAAALGALFQSNIPLEDISRRLAVYNEVRYKRAVTVMFMSRVGDDHRDEVMKDLQKHIPDAVLPENMWLYAWDSYPARDVDRLIASNAV
ncbi:hypothetical protein BKA67DRAFT_538101 [Truncatella angustata]|uniref:FAD-binding domain-containing protein n=1 Tax=Truncatella angustata TaxID=152316 RepID=A0A9P8UHK3_9PEZI|nr:uncharacterized protein BKA67DRAFT_538101 [Truncatella angustata]KAH6652281.1 hypothetical protein BKA67DRAFT_538101 [Truncatella angustata]